MAARKRETAAIAQGGHRGKRHGSGDRAKAGRHPPASARRAAAHRRIHGYLSASAAPLFKLLDRLAATLSAVMMGLFLLLIWLLMVAAGHISAFNWGKTYATWALAAAAWVVADSWRGVGWLGVDKRTRPIIGSA